MNLPMFPSLASGQEADPAGLGNLHDIAMPPPVSWWPPAPGWFALAALILLATVFLAWGMHRRRRINAYRRAALHELEGLALQIRLETDRVPALRRLPELLKRTALAAWPREEVAELNGEAWFAFLDRTGSDGMFGNGTGRMLSRLAYAGTEELESLTSDQVVPLISALEGWIRNHRVPEVRHA